MRLRAKRPSKRAPQKVQYLLAPVRGRSVPLATAQQTTRGAAAKMGCHDDAATPSLPGSQGPRSGGLVPLKYVLTNQRPTSPTVPPWVVVTTGLWYANAVSDRCIALQQHRHVK